MLNISSYLYQNLNWNMNMKYESNAKGLYWLKVNSIAEDETTGWWAQLHFTSTAAVSMHLILSKKVYLRIFPIIHTK